MHRPPITTAPNQKLRISLTKSVHGRCASRALLDRCCCKPSRAVSRRKNCSSHHRDFRGDAETRMDQGFCDCHNSISKERNALSRRIFFIAICVRDHGHRRFFACEIFFTGARGKCTRIRIRDQKRANQSPGDSRARWPRDAFACTHASLREPVLMKRRDPPHVSLSRRETGRLSFQDSPS